LAVVGDVNQVGGRQLLMITGSGSTVVTMTSKVNGTMEISTPCKYETLKNIETKI